MPLQLALQAAPTHFGVAFTRVCDTCSVLGGGACPTMPTPVGSQSSMLQSMSDVMHAPGTALSLYVFVLRKKSLREAERQVPTSLSTLSVAMHWLLASVVISLLLGVSIRQLQRGTSWRPSTSIASGPLERPRVQKISKSTDVTLWEKGCSPSTLSWHLPVPHPEMLQRHHLNPTKTHFLQQMEFAKAHCTFLSPVTLQMTVLNSRILS